MNYHQGGMGEQAVVRVLLPRSVLDFVHARADSENLSMSEVVRRMLEERLEVSRPAPPKPTMVVPVTPTPADETYIPNDQLSCMELLERRYTISQIASIKRISYKQVAAECNKHIDGLAARMGYR
jgi:hypothetical protein